MKYMMLLIAVLISTQAQSKNAVYQLPAVSAVGPKSGVAQSKGPLQYAVNTAVGDIGMLSGEANQGYWKKADNDHSIWTFEVSAEAATSLDFGFENFFLPPTAELTVSSSDKSVVKGPYTGSVNQPHGQFWPGTIPGNQAKIEIKIANRYKSYLQFNITNIPRGYVKFWELPVTNKSLSCNIDVACPEADQWQNQVNAVARYSFNTNSGSFFCSGQLINNTAEDRTPYFLTANHCGYETANSLQEKVSIAASMNVWWNYQSLTCRDPGSDLSGTQISISGFNDTQSGATYVASFIESDFALVELNEVPDNSFETYLSGWDRSSAAPTSAVSINHPQGHAKRIAIENNPLFISSPYADSGINNTHLTVNEWDLGKTEIGSSGGGLWNEQGLLVGQLHFGDVALFCSDPVSDSFGWFKHSWDAGSDEQSRLKDWLDPLNTNTQTLAGMGGCDAPEVTIINNSSNIVGESLTFTSQVSGGVGDYLYEWDINGDRGVDGTNSSINTQYSQSFVGNISLKVIDGSGCQRTASQAVVIEGPEVTLQQVVNIRENLDQVCGNNDGVIDPGERWRTLIDARNTGVRTASDSYLSFAVNYQNNQADIDDYGNNTSSCNRLFIDITNTGNELPWNSAEISDFSADDEGFVGIQLSQPFDHYGNSVAALVASSNGYISTSSEAQGYDWDNDCPLPSQPDKDDVGGRIAVFHDDLKSSTFYHQYFDTCPRQSETGEQLACEVFLWQGADLWSTSAEESIDIQAILYPTTSQWVYQYSANESLGSAATIGMQNALADDGLTFSCNENINSNEAVCVYNKNFKPNSSGPDAIFLETPVIALGQMTVDQSKTRNLDFAIGTGVACGGSFVINHEASVFNGGFNSGATDVLSGTVGDNGQCNVVTFCGADDFSNDLNPTDGLWWNPNRSGNGVDMHVTNQSSLLYVMYTGETDRSPIWYIANNENAAFNQYYNDILQVNYPNGYGQGNQQINTVGWSNTTFLNANEAIQVRFINEQLSAEKIILDQFASQPTANQHTGHYYAPEENGWGQSVITIGNTRVVISYIYDHQGQPFWTIGSGANNSAQHSVLAANTFCPHCPSVPIEVFDVGSMSMEFNGQTNGLINHYNISYPPQSSEPQASWNKTNLPIVNLVPADN